MWTVQLGYLVVLVVRTRLCELDGARCGGTGRRLLLLLALTRPPAFAPENRSPFSSRAKEQQKGHAS